MGYYCTVPQCTSLAGKTKNVKFHRFPRDVTMADKWNIILKRGKPYTKYSKVCSLHFTQGDYNVTTMGQWKTLSKDAVPSQNLPKLNADGTVMVIRKSRTVKYRDGRKEDSVSSAVERVVNTADQIEFNKRCEKDKWVLATPQHPALPLVTSQDTQVGSPDDMNLNFRLQTLSAIASAIPHHHPHTPHTPHPPHTPHAPHTPQTQQSHSAQSVHTHKPRKQDAIMQTDPVQSEEDDTQPEGGEPAPDQPPTYPYPKTSDSYEAKKYDAPKDYTKNEEDFIPQTNEEYNSEAEKYALERKSHNGYEKQQQGESYPKSVPMEGYPKMDLYPNFSDKAYPNRPENWYQNGYPDSAEILRSQQHNLQILQEQHRITENQNFFNESHIKRERDNADEEGFMYERAKDATAVYDAAQRRLQQQRLMEHLSQQVKQEPDASSGCDNVMQPQGSPYYSNGHNPAGGYYGEARPGAELLIAKQNALAAHTQLWQNTMKRPFFYSESPHYNSPPLLHRYEDISRILQ